MRTRRTAPRCALIEYNDYHGEILPTLVYVLNALGVHVDLYLSHKVIEQKPFLYTPGLRYSLRKTDGLFITYWERPREFRDYDFLVLSSIEPKGKLLKVSGLGVPVLAVLHNADLIDTDPDYRHFFASRKRSPLVLAKYIAASLSRTLDSRWISPVYIAQINTSASKRGNVCFCVQGNLEFRRRNYEALLDAVARLRSDGLENFRVLLVGRNDSEDGRVFKQQARNLNLDHFFEYTKGEVSYRDYYASLARAHFILPLVDSGCRRYRSYFVSKITSSLSVALGLGIVPVVDRQLAALYGIEEQAVTYGHGQLYDGLKRALSADNETLGRMRAELLVKKEALLRRSVVNVKETLSALGIRIQQPRT